jgi:prephenate dehydratase
MTPTVIDTSAAGSSGARRIAFQGELGAFSQVAAERFLGPDAVPVPLPTFQQVFEAVANGTCAAAAIPIENTLHGSIHENYDHLLKFDLGIRAETFVRIVHNLIAAPGVEFADLKRVFSHPVALAQCLHFFAENPGIQKTTYYDTAGSVKMVMGEGLRDAAAIASAAAAPIYGANILRESIEDDRQNFTRFFLLRPNSAPPEPPPVPDVQYKTSIVFTVKNVPGALFRSLAALALRDLDMTKIESRPLRGRPGEYLFYLDFVAAPDEAPARNALGHLRELADMLRILGSYPAGSYPSA